MKDFREFPEINTARDILEQELIEHYKEITPGDIVKFKALATDARDNFFNNMHLLFPLSSGQKQRKLLRDMLERIEELLGKSNQTEEQVKRFSDLKKSNDLSQKKMKEADEVFYALSDEYKEGNLPYPELGRETWRDHEEYVSFYISFYQKMRDRGYTHQELVR